MTEHTQTIKLDAACLADHRSVYSFLKTYMDLPESSEKSLDALSDALSEVTQDFRFTADRQTVAQICENSFAFSVLRVLTRAADENPHLHFLLEK
ncbi:MAG: hypothetical protein ACOX78_06995 [Lachnospiraceae bacterium]|jgi:RNAse (barnase) inhibitor barstar